MWIGKHVFYYTIATARLRIRETIKKAIARRVFDQMIEIAFFFVAKRFAVADEKLKVAGVWLIDVRVVNLVEDSVTEREPDTATCMVGRANAFFCARGPTRLDPRRPKGDCILRRIHLLPARSKRQRLICVAMFSADGAPIARVILWILFIRVIRVIFGRLLSFFMHIRGSSSLLLECVQPTEAVRVTVAETYFASWRGNFRSSTVTFCMGKVFSKCAASRSANVSIRLTD